MGLDEISHLHRNLTLNPQLFPFPGEDPVILFSKLQTDSCHFLPACSFTCILTLLSFFRPCTPSWPVITSAPAIPHHPTPPTTWSHVPTSLIDLKYLRAIPVISSYVGFTRCPCLLPLPVSQTSAFLSAPFAGYVCYVCYVWLCWLCLPAWFPDSCMPFWLWVNTFISIYMVFKSLFCVQSFDLRDYYLFMVVLTYILHRQYSQTGHVITGVKWNDGARESAAVDKKAAIKSNSFQQLSFCRESYRNTYILLDLLLMY